jgi:hypothetical protein
VGYVSINVPGRDPEVETTFMRLLIDKMPKAIGTEGIHLSLI